MKNLVRNLLLALILVFSLNEISFADEAVFRKVLDNGLVVLAKESPPGDLVSVNVTVLAGITSEGEYTASGISHLVEHMLFKGTASRRAGDIEKEIRSYGGFINGAVSTDITVYQVTVPSKYLQKVLALFKDMLMNSAFDKVEMEKEREVIIKEINFNKDDPQKRLMVSLFSEAYLRHPYKYPAIGYERLLRSLTREDLLNYYNKVYVPDRMVVSIVGDIDDRQAALTVENEFGDFRRPRYGPIPKEREPAQIGAKYAQSEAATTLSYMALGFHSSSILDKELFALDVLSMILGRGDNSRLNKKLLKEEKLVYSVTAANYTPQDPGLFIITAMLAKDDIGPAQKIILEEISRIKAGEIDDKELETAKRLVMSDYIFSRETIEEQAKDLGESEILTGNYDFFRRYVDGISKVTKSDISNAALSYLKEDNMTSFSLVPKSESTLPVKIERPKTEDKIEERILPNGLRILARRNTKIPALSITVAFSGGVLTEDSSNNGISNMVSRMLLKGTKNRKESEIKGTVENLGGELSSFSGLNSFGLDITVLKKDLDFALELIKEIITNPTFPEQEMYAEKTLTLAAIKDEDDDIFQKGALALRRSIFQSHPYGMRYIGEKASIGALKRDDLIKYFNAWCVPNNTVISISGDIEPDKVFKTAGELFKNSVRREIPKINVKGAVLDKMKSQALKMDKEQSLLMVGFKTIGVNDPDRYTLDVLESVLSGSSGRLFTVLRDKMALAYTLGCVQKLGLEEGFMLFYAATTKDNLADAKKALMAQLKLIREAPVTDEELANAKKETIFSRKAVMQTNSFCSMQSALDELYGLGYGSMYKYEKNIDKVTKDDLLKAANKYLKPDAYAEVTIKPE